MHGQLSKNTDSLISFRTVPGVKAPFKQAFCKQLASFLQKASVNGAEHCSSSLVKLYMFQKEAEFVAIF
jgi:hypothetical protein